MISFEPELKLLKNKFINKFKDHLDNNEFIGGLSVLEFESKIKNYLNTKNAISVGSGTDALIIALEGLRILNPKKGKKIIVPAFSFFATSEAIVKAGYEPIFVDVELTTGNIDVSKIEQNITRDTVGIMVVHLFGKPANLNKIMIIAKKYKLFLVEDVAQAFGSTLKTKHLGTIGDVGCFSFFPSKNLGAFGDGGLITTDSNQLAEICRKLKNHGSVKKYENEYFGYNSRLDSIQASFLSLKLEIIDDQLESRKQIGNYYIEKLKENKNIVLMDYKDSTFNYFSICIENNRDLLSNYLDSYGISSAVYYPMPLPYLKAHNIKLKNNNFDNALYLSKNILSLPIWPNMELKLVDFIVDKINKFK